MSRYTAARPSANAVPTRRGESREFCYLDRAGRRVISPQFAAATEFCDGYAVVQLDAEWGLIDQSWTNDQIS